MIHNLHVQILSQSHITLPLGRLHPNQSKGTQLKPVTHLQLIQPQQDPHRLIKSTKVQPRPHSSCKNWTTYNSCNGIISLLIYLCCISDWKECSSFIDSKKVSNIIKVCD